MSEKLDIEAAIKSAVAARTSVVVDEEIEEAKKRVEKRMRREIALIALSVAETYDISNERTHVIIRVRRDIEPAR